MNTFKQFIFGDTVTSDKALSPDEATRLIGRAKEARDNRPPSTPDIMQVFSGMSKAWQNPSYQPRRRAIAGMRQKASLSAEMIDMVFEEFPRLIAPEALTKKIEGELGSPYVQDEPVLQGSTKARLIFQPAGLTLHVASGNVFLAGIESILDGIITKNTNFLKMSTADREFPIIFAESMKEFDRSGVITKRLALLWWEGGDNAVEAVFKKEMDRIVFWGGYDALTSWESGLGPGTVLVRHGPKISFGVISKEGLESAEMAELTDRVAFDTTIWEQRACNCPQMLFLEETIPDEKIGQFIDSLKASLDRMAGRFPPAGRTDDEDVEVLKTREVAMARHFMTGEPVLVAGPKTLEWTIVHIGHPNDSKVELSPLNRTLIVKRFASARALEKILKDHSFYLQTIGYCLAEREVPDYAVILSRLGATRLCRFGVMAIPTPGAPHDGGYALRDLTRATVIE